MAPSPSTLPSLPIVGRARELATIRAALDNAENGRGGTLFLTGPPGAGKSRLALATREEGERRGFLVVAGCAYPMESGIPYSIFCDLLEPMVRRETPEVRVAWTRGAPEFGLLCPSLVTDGSDPLPAEPDGMIDLRNRLLWNLPGFLNRLRRDQALLLVFEDLQWADPSSLELLHFLGRRSGEHSYLILGTYRSQEARTRSDIEEVSRTLEARGEAHLMDLGPLEAEDVVEAVSRAFEVSPDVIRGFSRALHRSTGGNPFLLNSVIESLVASGRLHKEGGSWVGWSFDRITLPTSVRELVVRELASLDESSRHVLELAAVTGSPTSFRLLQASTKMNPVDLLVSVETLLNRHMIKESRDGHEVVYTFVHPIVRDVVYGELGLARSRFLHSELARTLMRMHGKDAIHHASELAGHFLHGDPQGERGGVYLATAGRRALDSHANREAERFLEAALDILPNGVDDGDDGRFNLLVDLARARQRLGRHGPAEDLLRRARAIAVAHSDHARMARVDRRLGLLQFWTGRPDVALGHWERGLKEAQTAEDPILEARIQLGRSVGLQEAGQPDGAVRAAEEALRIGEETGDVDLRQAAHRTLALLHTWTGPPDTARRHGRRALKLAERLSRESARFSAHRTMAVLEGLTGHITETRRHLEEAAEIADRLESPLLKLDLADVWIEYCAGVGHWSHGVDVAEESIRMARELDQRKTLPRILVWSGLLHLDRGDLEVARRQLTEAWDLAGVPPGSHSTGAHVAVLAHVGMTALHMASGNHADAIEMGERGLKLVERSGSRIWAIHRLLPLMAEAALHLRDLDRVRDIAERLRRESEAFGHPIGSVWADCCDALATWLEGDVERGARAMAAAADRLDSIDTVPYAARLRRQLAGRLAELGDRDAAVHELRRVHEVLSSLGAGPELDKARNQFREVGARPPTRSTAPGTGLLTLRETEVARLVGLRKSNKGIAKELGISHRTVGTHLTSIFRKLNVSTRSQLGDRIRSGVLDELV